MTMSHPSTTGNGCSLEDCHTNLFALTDLAGIKWQRWKSETAYYVEPLDDPVLLSFSRCIKKDILCVWRRKVHRYTSNADPPPVYQLGSSKELWVFWYGEEPTHLQNLLSPDLKEEDRGSWDQGLSYECRTLLFKALHNLIERCLLGQNFVRLGKWFVQPHPHTSPSANLDRSSHLSIRFSFFLHGESTVCASIDVRQHPPLCMLHPQHLALAQQVLPQGVPVILGPYGLSGTLTGHTYKDAESTTQKLLEEWDHFYVFPHQENTEGFAESILPPAVEVIVAGVRMRYPSNFVLMTAETEAELLRQQGNGLSVPPSATSGIQPLSPPMTPTMVHTASTGGVGVEGMPKLGGLVGSPELSVELGTGTAVGERVVEKVWQDCAITSAVQGHQSRHQQTETSNDEPSPSTYVWDFGEPTQKNPCGCPKSRGKSRQSANQNKPGMSGKHIKVEKGEKGEKEKPSSRHGRSSSFFHRRSHQEPMVHRDMDMMMQRIPATSLSSKQSGAQSGTAGLPQLRGVGQGGMTGNATSNFDQSADSPHSGVPSPLQAQMQPSVSQNGDPTMPTLSPHPPAKTCEKDLAASSSSLQSIDQSDPVGGAANHTSASVVNTSITNNTLAGPADTSKLQQPVITPKVEPGHFAAPVGTVGTAIGGPDVKVECVNTWLDTQKEKQADIAGLKRPMLPAQNYEDGNEDVVPEALYDFEGINAWLEHPVKRQRFDAASPVKPTSTPPLGQARPPSPVQDPKDDPYEFTDDDTGQFLRRTFRNSREDSFSRQSIGSKPDDEFRRGSDGNYSKDDMKASLDLSPPTPNTSATAVATSLTRAVDLVPRLNDLDHLFDTDSEHSDSDAFAPAVEAAIKPSEEPIKQSITKTSNLVNSIPLGPTPELLRMFPTPPSTENQGALSPSQTMEQPPDITDLHNAKMEADLKRSIEEDIKRDQSFVFKPAPLSMFVGSKEYAPIELPSSKEKPLPLGTNAVYKPSWQYQSPPSHYPNLPSVENAGSVTKPGVTERMTSIEASPATFGQPSSAQQRTPRTPMSYELQSPLSNASSYLNKNSVDNHGTNSQLPEIHSLVVNVILSDSILNLFKDHNFDSCPTCVCNMNIKGADMGLYLPERVHEEQRECSCGFSAVVNRKYGANAGLFYEDEVDITGIRSDRLDHRKPRLAFLLNQDKDGVNKDNVKFGTGETIPDDILLLLQGQFSTLYPSCAIGRCVKHKHPSLSHSQPDLINHLEIQDGCEACLGALEVGRQVSDNCPPTRLDDPSLRNSPLLNKWPYLQSYARIPTNSQDVVRLLKTLQPLLQDAIQKKRTARAWEAVYTITGPLSWKDFHLLAGRGTEEASAPQPIPPLLVGYDKDWLSLSPHALRHWDKMMLEPYGRPRDMVYVIVAPDNEYVLSHVQPFFRELTRCYELCRLGRHRPISKLREGVMRVGKSNISRVAHEPVDEWFTEIGNSPVATKLRVYAQVCAKYLAPFLATQPLEKAFEVASNASSVPSRQPQPHDPSSHGCTPSSSWNPSMPPQSQSCNSHQGSAPSGLSGSNSQGTNVGHNVENQLPSQVGNSDADKNDGDGIQGSKDSSQEGDMDSSEHDSPGLVIYMIEPFTYGQDWDEWQRLAMLGLLRCYQDMWRSLPEHLRSNTQLQIVPQQVLLDQRDSSTSQFMKNLCLSVYTQSRRLLAHSSYILGRSLTGFGPASAAEVLLKGKDPHTGKLSNLHLYSPPFVLAPGRLRSALIPEPATVDLGYQPGVLLCAYCLSEDQRWLLASCTDNYGEVLETCTINIDIPNRNRRKKASARKIGLAKLWDFIVGMIGNTARAWRLVVGRFGRLGHGELKGWAAILSKKHLQKSNQQLKEMCNLCSLLPSIEIPTILSACLVSMEVHHSIHIMTDSVKMEEKKSSSSQLSTPRDASCTHILVFPTSARAQANQGGNQQENHQDDRMVLDGMPDGMQDEDLMNIMGIGQDMNNDMNNLLFDDLFSEDVPMPVLDQPQSDCATNNENTMNGMKQEANGATGDIQEENHTFLEQPLAMGFYVSTAQTGPLPKWFWSACPQREGLCPTCLKAALHIHCPLVPQGSDDHDDINDHTAKFPGPSHPLDSSLTCDVLRYVLETYNALSWLTMDPATNDRRSCLPCHFVVLMQLYQAMNAFV